MQRARKQQQNSAEAVAGRTAPPSPATPATLEPAKEPIKSASTALAEASSHVADSCRSIAPAPIWAFPIDDLESLGRQVRYRFTWDRALGSVKRTSRVLTGWIRLTAAYRGVNLIELPPRLSGPCRAHLYADYPCFDEWLATRYEQAAHLGTPILHLLECDPPTCAPPH